MPLNGIDIASYQKDMNVSGVDADFVIIKITQGDYYVNPNFDRQFKEAEKAGKLIGAYHYSNGVTPAKTEVDFLLKAIKPYIGKLIICLDWETNGLTKKSGKNPIFGTKDQVNYVREFAYLLHSEIGVWPFVYMSASVTRSSNWDSVAQVCPLWVAQYANDKLTGYQVKPYRDTKGTGAWKEVKIHQYSPSGTIKGYEQTDKHKLDMDIAYLTRDEWLSFAKGSKKVSKPVTPDVIKRVFDNEFGTGASRKAKLEASGYDYEQVRSKINEISKSVSQISAIKKESGDYWSIILNQVK